MKQLLSKFSEFEKPYLDESYPEMNLELPVPDWPRWWWTWWGTPHGTWGPLPKAPVPDPTGPRSHFTLPPYDSPIKGCVGGCAVMDMPATVERGETYVLWIWTLSCSLGGKTIARESATLTEIGPGSISVKHGIGPFMTVLTVDASAPADELVCVSAETSGGLGMDPGPDYCAACAVVEGGCPEAPNEVSIEYTTTTMVASTSQTLNSSDGRDYWWHVTYDGSTSKTFGNDVVLQAPATNAECAKEFEVDLKDKKEDGETCDSVTIQISAIRCGAGPREAFYACCDSGGEFPRTCFTVYDCHGEQIIGAGDACCGYDADDCASVPGCELGSAICAESAAGSCPAAWNDYRTGQMITDGCCPDIPS